VKYGLFDFGLRLQPVPKLVMPPATLK